MWQVWGGGGQGRFMQGFGGKTRGTRGLEALSVHGKIIFKWNFKKRDRGRSCELDCSGSRQGQVAGTCEKKLMNLWVL